MSADASRNAIKIVEVSVSTSITAMEHVIHLLSTIQSPFWAALLHNNLPTNSWPLKIIVFGAEWSRPSQTIRRVKKWWLHWPHWTWKNNFLVACLFLSFLVDSTDSWRFYLILSQANKIFAFFSDPGVRLLRIALPRFAGLHHQAALPIDEDSEGSRRAALGAFR